MWFGVVTLFVDMIRTLQTYGVLARAIQHNLIQIENWNPRDYTRDKHRTVDDRPYGGGPGMLMKVQPLRDAIGAAKKAAPAGTKVLYLSPQGRRLDQQGVQEIASWKHVILVAGRYEGIDERVIMTDIDEQWSVGDYVLSGGELAAMVVIDAVSRLVPGTLGHKDSACQDSFAQGLLDCPHYTRPDEVAGMKVPPVLLSGNHEQIERWRLKEALRKTQQYRPDLFLHYPLSDVQKQLLDEINREDTSSLL